MFTSPIDNLDVARRRVTDRLADADRTRLVRSDRPRLLRVAR